MRKTAGFIAARFDKYRLTRQREALHLDGDWLGSSNSTSIYEAQYSEVYMGFLPEGLTPLIGVFDMPEALAFYRDVLGFAVVAASPEVVTVEGRFSHWMWLKFGSAEIMLNTQYDSNERPARRPERVPSNVVFYIGCSDVELAHQELSMRGLSVDPPKTAPYGLKIFHAEDPDGHTLVFQQASQQSNSLNDGQSVDKDVGNRS